MIDALRAEPEIVRAYLDDEQRLLSVIVDGADPELSRRVGQALLPVLDGRSLRVGPEYGVMPTVTGTLVYER